ncbi:MAG TPA: hypothetical protein VNR60_09930 [Croceibacterium sp.]|nr:hypothetical protein [Croceibacterium sp.]
MNIPPVGADGHRMTVNANLNENEAIWHFRSAWNVAALNCLDTKYQPVLESYGSFLKQHSRKLTSTNTALDTQFRTAHGSRNEGVKAREALMTSVYNYFALPPTLVGLCETALSISTEYQTTPPQDIAAFSVAGLQRFEAVFGQFFNEYDQYRVASAEWDMKYGSRYGASQPGYVAVHGASGPALASALLDSSASPVGEVLDPTTGARIPLVAPADSTISTPIVQPLAGDAPDNQVPN